MPGDDDDLNELGLAGEITELGRTRESAGTSGDDKPKDKPDKPDRPARPKDDDFWALAPREPIRAPVRSGRTRVLLVLGGVALLAFAIGLVTPTPESVELSGNDSNDGSNADVPRLEVPVGWSVTPLVVQNPTAVPQDELMPLINELLTATAEASSSANLPASPQLAVCDPARHPGLLSANPELTQQDLDKLSAALC